ncbi:MAG TPA: hypothetical protein PK079_03235 [Leptospiraceae bacterium]|nr:hypothetical protein [Leptospiraceae bacterium]HMW03767.1 hypothetical protein [Leptospiraceae bacterium]HMX34249.1 hypothetical protein [Leptospiraceae bacterium]HMY29747.1 hypothetical protein [Leptospiraceae bacterium]HMZ62854.1 hypothetical protein [Leptospiraceae bacterium]
MKEKKSYENKVRVEERCYLVQNFERLVITLDVADYIHCPKIYNQLYDVQEILSKNYKAMLFIQEKIAIVSQKCPHKNSATENFNNSVKENLDFLSANVPNYVEKFANRLPDEMEKIAANPTHYPLEPLLDSEQQEYRYSKFL